jgi:hypothetical protein
MSPNSMTAQDEVARYDSVIFTSNDRLVNSFAVVMCAYGAATRHGLTYLGDAGLLARLRN